MVILILALTGIGSGEYYSGKVKDRRRYYEWGRIMKKVRTPQYFDRHLYGG
jgi:hypothetical protein